MVASVLVGIVFVLPLFLPMSRSIIPPCQHDVKDNHPLIDKDLITEPARWCKIAGKLMDESALYKKFLSDMARRGGKARAKKLTAEQRRKSAIKASKAAAKARTRKAKERKRVRESEK